MYQLELTHEQVAEVLRRASDTNSKALQNGVELRRQMNVALEEGRVPEGYRYPWLKESGHQVVDFLGKLGESFNLLHPGDRISVSDLLDILEAARRELLEK